MENHLTVLDTVFRALADPTRRAVVHQLVDGGPAPVTELARPFEIGLPTFMKHLKVLEESGLVRSEKAGRVRTCHVQAERLEAAESWLAQQRSLWRGRTDRLADYAEKLAAKREVQ